MATRTQAPCRPLLTIMATLLSLVAQALAIDQTFCSTFNTGSSNQPLYDIYMSAGKCKDTCNGQGAFGIVQGKNCWCSNYAPSDQLSADTCDNTCPGYPSEYCGADGFFGYIAEGPAALGTIGGSTSQQDRTSTPPTSSQAQLQATSIVLQTSVNIVVSTQVARPASTPSSSSKSQVSSASWTPTPVTSIQIVTTGGAVITNYVTIIPSTPIVSSSQQNITTTRKPGLSNGAVAGITIGAVAGAALLSLFLFFCCWKRRRNNRDDEGGIRRNTSVLDKVGLLRSGSAKPLAGKQPPRIQTSDLALGVGAGPASAGTLGSDSQMSESRRSRPLFVDQRLNPHALFAQPNASRTSVGTLQDNQDYSRPLEIRNPD